MTDDFSKLKPEIVEFYSRMRSMAEKLPPYKELEKDPIFLAGQAYGQIRLAEAILKRIETHQKLSNII